jgi:hypothetical protein
VIEAAPQPAVHKRATFVILAAVVFALAVFLGVRWNMHGVHVRSAERASIRTGHLAAIYAHDLEKMHVTGNAYSAKFKAMVAAFSDSGSGILGQLGVSKGYADSLLADTSFDDLIAKIRSDVSGPDPAFDSSVTAFMRNERSMRDSLRAFTTTETVVLNNPFMLSVLTGENSYALGHKIGVSVGALADSWSHLESHVSHLRDAAAAAHTTADAQLREIKARNALMAPLNP